MSGITDANGHSIASDKPEPESEVKKVKDEKMEMMNPALVKSGMLDYNFIRHTIDMTMLEANMAQMDMQMQAQKMIVPPPEMEMMKKHHAMLAENINMMINEKNVRSEVVDNIRKEQYNASLKEKPPIQ